MSIFKRYGRIQGMEDRLEKNRYVIIEKNERIQELVAELAMKDEIIRALKDKQKRLEKRIERMLYELRISDAFLIEGKNDEECK